MLKAFITNLGKYNEGYLIGEWIEFPISKEELNKVFKRIGINKRYEEFFFTDYENNVFGLGEFESIERLNKIGEMLEGLEDEKILFSILDYGYDVEEAIEIVKDCDYVYYSNCNDMTDVAYEYVEQSGMLDNIPEFAQIYFNYEQFGRDLMIEGNFVGCGDGYIEISR